jgi:hypothetical protein
MVVQSSVLVPVISLFLIGILLIWAFTGGLWRKKAGSIDFRQIYRQQLSSATASSPTGSITSATTPQDAIEPGAAERIQNYLFKGTDIPGFSLPPPVQPNERQRRERARIEAEKPLRLATQARAILDLRTRLGGVAKQDISLASWSERTWLDSALGCAQPGAVVVPANLPGWMFVLTYAGDKHSFYIYNATRDGKQLRFCRRERNSTES